LFVDFRHALGDDIINSINEKIVQLKTMIEEKRKKDSNRKHGDHHDVACDEESSLESSRSSESSEQPAGEIKAHTYRKEARKEYLHTAQRKNKSKKEIRKAVGKQLRYLKRNISIIDRLLDSY
jgi:hypothetical protein